VKAYKRLTEKVAKGEGGFTLIELLIVIIILGILAAVVAFNVSGFLGAGTEETAKTEAASLQTAIVAAMAACSVGTVEPGTDVTGDVSNVTLVLNATGNEGILGNRPGRQHLDLHVKIAHLKKARRLKPLGFLFIARL